MGSGKAKPIPVSTSITVATRKKSSKRNAISAMDAVGIEASLIFLFLIISFFQIISFINI